MTAPKIDKPLAGLAADEEFVRPASVIREWISGDGSTPFPAEAGRYHLYISWACPWAHRTAIVRHLKGLDGVVSMSAGDPIRDERSWAFNERYPDPTPSAAAGRPTGVPRAPRPPERPPGKPERAHGISELAG